MNDDSDYIVRGSANVLYCRAVDSVVLNAVIIHARSLVNTVFCGIGRPILKSIPIDEVQQQEYRCE